MVRILETDKSLREWMAESYRWAGVGWVKNGRKMGTWKSRHLLSQAHN